MKDWTTLEDGGSGRWIYSREVAPLTWVFLRIDDMVDACGGDATYYFHCDVGVVDLEQAIKCGTLTSALESCDAESWMADLPADKLNLAMAQCLFDHGAWSPLWQDGSSEMTSIWLFEPRSYSRARRAVLFSLCTSRMSLG